MYKQVITPCEHTIIIKRSVFITTLLPIDSTEDAESALAGITKKYSDATHNTYAYIANDIATVMRFSDAGEPQGTAGIPMLEVLKKRYVYKTLAVVTRYFGGVKLGASGLVSAYSGAVSTALDSSPIKTFIMSQIINFVLEYSFQKAVIDLVGVYSGSIITNSYTDKVAMRVAVPLKNYENFKLNVIDSLSGKINIIEENKEYFAY